jgi:hypothetical protein
MVKGVVKMPLNLKGDWNHSISHITSVSFICGFCGSKAGPSKGYTCYVKDKASQIPRGNIYICPNCNKPTFINKIESEQVPGPIMGDEIEYLPEGIERLYNEARKCISVSAYTSSVLSCRKLLMNVSVSKGAQPGKTFAYYVNFLEDNHYIPPNSKEWVDHIRKKGNEATHEIPEMSMEDAIELIEFTEMLLRFVYEMPGKMTKHKTKINR